MILFKKGTSSPITSDKTPTKKYTELTKAGSCKTLIIATGKTDIKTPRVIASRPAKDAKPRTDGAGACRNHSGIRRSNIDNTNTNFFNQ